MDFCAYANSFIGDRAVFLVDEMKMRMRMHNLRGECV